MALHINRHAPTMETSETQTSQEVTQPATQKTPAGRVPTLNVDSRRTPDSKSIDRVALSLIRSMVEQAIAEQTAEMLRKLRKELKQCENQTLTHTASVIAQAKKKFEASIEEMIEVDLLPNLTPELVSDISDLLGETKESQNRKERALQNLQNMQDTIALENKTNQLRASSWENSKYTPQEAISILCELVSKYIPADVEAARLSSLQESEEILTHSKYTGEKEREVASDKQTYLQNTPIYRAVLLFRAAKVDCDSMALCGTCPFRSKGDECRLWKMAFALHDIAFYRAQAVSQAQYENTIENKLTEAQIEISALQQQLSEEVTKNADLQSKLDKITSGSKHLTSARKQKGEDDNYETELDPFLRFS